MDGKKLAVGLVGAGVILGAGGAVAPNAGISNAAAFLPAAGTIGGAGIEIGMLKGMLPKK